MTFRISLALLLLSCACAASRPARPARPESRATSAAGGSVDLELKDTPLIDALVLLAGSAQVSIFAGTDLDAPELVTMRLQAASAEDALATIASEHQLRVEKLEVRGAEHAAFWISKQSSPSAPVTSFVGERITARFDDVPIRDVAKALAEFSKTHIVVDDGVQASITLHLRLPWDLALYHLAQKYDLRITRSDRLIRISGR